MNEQNKKRIFQIPPYFPRDYLNSDKLMDLDDIIGDSDPEEEVLTSKEIIDRLCQAWRNEKASPVLLETYTAVVDLVRDNLKTLEERIANYKKGDERGALLRIQHERIRYILTDYLRIRLRKIEKYTDHILEEEGNRPEDDPPHLSPDEFRFAKAHSESIQDYFKSLLIPRMPANMQKLDQSAMAVRPNRGAYVCFYVNRDIDGLEVVDGLAENREKIYIDLRAGEQHIMPFYYVEPYLRSGSITLM